MTIDRSLRKDTRGAVMVVAVFMAVFLVGALWYIVGLGDAMIYRERMQESADAVAFSSAVVHARGMNIIAMMNLIMAAVMAVLVALKVAQLILGIIAAIAAVILAASLGTCAPCAAVIGFCTTAIAEIQQIINTIKQPIFNTLKAISTAQKAVAEIVPWLSEGEAVYLGNQYGKPVKLALAASPSMMPSSGSVKTYGLPVEDGNYAKLCGKAGHDVGEFIFLPVEIILGSSAGPVEAMGNGLGNVIGSLTESVSSFFCEGGSTGGGTGSASTKTRDKLAHDQCMGQYQAWDKWKNHGGPDSGFDHKYMILGGVFREDLCESDLKAQFDKQMQNNPKGANDSGVDSDVQSRTPKKVSVGGSGSDAVKNGSSHFGVWSFVLGDTSGLHYAPKLVEIAGWGKKKVSDPGSTVQFGIAKAEFFYDCSGSWDSKSCDDDEEAMWNMRWRARLRNVEMPTGAVGSLLGGVMSSGIASWVNGGGFSGGGINAGDLGNILGGWSSPMDPSSWQGAFQSWMQQAVQENQLLPGGSPVDPSLVSKLQSLQLGMGH
jgi:hypothetical protein